MPRAVTVQRAQPSRSPVMRDLQDPGRRVAPHLARGDEVRSYGRRERMRTVPVVSSSAGDLADLRPPRG